MTKADRIYVGPEVARRLKVEAAKQGLTIGRLVELILDRAVWPIEPFKKVDGPEQAKSSEPYAQKGDNSLEAKFRERPPPTREELDEIAKGVFND